MYIFHSQKKIAKQILEIFRNENGCYLIRKTSRNENILVLSLMFNAEFFNYEICIKETSPCQQRLFFIDDGPYFRNLSHLVEHYSKYEDGLPGLLLKPIRPNSALLSSNTAKLSNHKQVNSSSSSSSSTSSVSNISNTTQSLNLNQQLVSKTTVNLNENSLNKRSDALTKANLFKSRTLLNDQSKKMYYC